MQISKSRVKRDPKSVASSKMSCSLSADIWECVASLLQPISVYRLTCCGDKRLIKAIERRKTATFYGCSAERLKWPHYVTEDTNIQHLTVKITERHNFAGSLGADAVVRVQNLPRTLVSLRLKTSSSTPFSCDNMMGTLVKLEQLRTALPLLETFHCTINTKWSNQHWVIPPSVTSAKLNGGSFLKLNREAPLPANLKILIADYSLDVPADTVPPPLPKTLEVLVAGYLTEDLSYLQSLHTVAKAAPSCQLHKLPSLTRASGSMWFDGESLYPSLTDLHLEHSRSDIEYLPRTITRWTIDNHQLELVTPGQIKDLPPALRYLRFAPQSINNELSVDLLSSLPRNLAFIDLRWTRIDPEIALPLFPATLTTLRTHNLTKHNAHHLARFTILKELGLFGGQLTASFVRKIPRTVETLLLIKLSLNTKGYYYIKGSTEKHKYSMQNPDLTALDGTLPPRLTKLVVAPLSIHTYWSLFAYDIFKSIPTSLTFLTLDLGWETPVSLHPRSSPLFLHNPVSCSNEDYKAPKSDVDRSTDLFSRLTDLKHLFVNGDKAAEDRDWFSRRLPRHLHIYYGPRMSIDEVTSLPKSIVYLSPSSYCYLEKEVTEVLGRPPTSFHWSRRRYKFGSNSEDTFFSELLAD